MGWSCRKEASNVLHAWQDKCSANSTMSNVWEEKGKRYFFEVSSKEHDDGAITGTILLQLGVRPDGSGPYRKTGTFRIEGDGRITRAPKFLKEVIVKQDNLGYGIGSGG